MTIIGATIATTTQDLRELIQHVIIHEIEGRVNLTIDEDGKVNVWQPANVIMEESVTPFPRQTAMTVVSDIGAMSDEQPTDNIQH